MMKRRPGELPATSPGQCILIVEDEMLLAMMLEDMLTDLGYCVVKAARVTKATDLAATAAIDCDDSHRRRRCARAGGPAGTRNVRRAWNTQGMAELGAIITAIVTPFRCPVRPLMRCVVVCKSNSVRPQLGQATNSVLEMRAPAPWRTL